ncbi:MAG: 4-hydroxy-3-methylbut-2-enyl diphosphate reductase [Acidimicrobiia bacterium]|nr:4-hydroxy-3-methylbut-2-enyl diphosphate reductase [Acidimicrobiia bacterium]
MVKKVYLAQPRGFCAGVEMAIKALSFLANSFEKPIYCYHEIVHNRIVVERFENKGVIFVNSIDEVPQGAVVMLSAHGTAPEIVKDSNDENRISINAVCPLVTKVHHEAKTRTKKNYEILYIGHQGHDEAIGTKAVAPNNIHIIENEEQLNRAVESISEGSPVALLAQTTLAMEEWQEMQVLAKNKFPELWTASKGDLCFATTNRQIALRKLVDVSDAIIVIGSDNSSNTLALEKVALERGCKRVFRIDSPDDVETCDLANEDIVGVTAGASAPEDIVQAVIYKLNARDGVELVDAINEDEYFPPPRELRELATDLNYAIFNIFNLRKKQLNIKENIIDDETLRSVFKDDRHKNASDSLTN